MVAGGTGNSYSQGYVSFYWDKSFGMWIIFHFLKFFRWICVCEEECILHIKLWNKTWLAEWYILCSVLWTENIFNQLKPYCLGTWFSVKNDKFFSMRCILP